MIFNLQRLAVLGLVTCCHASDPQDLGTITPRRAITLDACTRRHDFLHFDIQVMQGTNTFNIVTTNRMLTVDDLGVLREGRAVAGVRSVCLDGAESRMTVVRFDLQREGPDAPTVKAIGVLTPRVDVKLETLLKGHRDATRGEPPPVPGGKPVTMRVFSGAPPPLPGSTNESYSAYQRRLAETSESGRRRSE